MLNKELIEVIIKANPGVTLETLPPILVKELQRINYIRNSRSLINENKIKAKEEYEMKCKNLNTEMTELQKNCKHETQSYNGDPSGGRDSFYECDICGRVK